MLASRSQNTLDLARKHCWKAWITKVHGQERVSHRQICCFCQELLRLMSAASSFRILGFHQNGVAQRWPRLCFLCPKSHKNFFNLQQLLQCFRSIVTVHSTSCWTHRCDNVTLMSTPQSITQNTKISFRMEKCCLGEKVIQIRVKFASITSGRSLFWHSSNRLHKHQL